MSKNSERSDHLSALKRALLAIDEMQNKLDAAERQKNEPIAIIGMGCRFPGGANNPEAFWRLLHQGVDAITEIPSSRWNLEAYYDPDPDAPGKMYTRYGGFLDEIDRFDAQFFSISPREAVNMDPQQRLLVEVSWEALENAGLAPDKLIGSKTGVFIGVMENDYAKLHIKTNDPTNISAHYVTGNHFSFTAGRLSYILGLHGPSLALDAACSSSLVAVHLACQSLRLGESDLALAGGVNLILSPELHITMCKFKALAADGRCKTFDAAADGFAPAEGCGLVLLKRLSDAVADGDRILALIRGSAVNHDGPSGGLTVPNGLAQRALIRQALVNAEVNPCQVSYVEAHGTGTSLGDPIEVRALESVMGEEHTEENPLMIGSVKTNLGHLDSAAGIAGLIKVVLSLQNDEIPPHLHFKEINPHISLDKISMKIPTSRIPWPAGSESRIAGISAFGLSGSNAHMVVEEAPALQNASSEIERPLHLLNLSAKSEPALMELANRYVRYLASEPSTSLADVCFTANTGRAHFEERLSVIADSSEQAHHQLAAWVAGEAPADVYRDSVAGAQEPKVAFLFTGQGAQYVGMGRQLYETQPTFRKTLDKCDEILRSCLEQPLLSVLYPGSESSALLNETAYTQPALFAIEYASAKLWQSWGLEPAVVAGHSVGEYVAACIAGVFSLEDGIKLIAERGRLIQSLARNGMMAAVFADEGRAAAAIAPYGKDVSIAAINSPSETVISGKSDAVQNVLKNLRAEGIESRALKVSHAFHSPLMEPILDAFEQTAEEVSYSEPQIVLISNVTGQPVNEGEVSNAGYWRAHIQKPVRFMESMKFLHQQGYKLFVEMGPQPILSAMGVRCLPDKGDFLPSIRKEGGDWRQILETLGALYRQGVPVDWAAYDRDYKRCKLALPTYPFQRNRYWLEGIESKPRSKMARLPEHIHGKAQHPLLGQRLSSPLKEVQFETYLSTDRLSFLSDHRVYGAVVMPGTAYIEMAIAAVRAVFGQEKNQLEGIMFQKALIMPEDTSESRTVQVLLSPDGNQKASFRVASLTENGDWTLHATGEAYLGESESESKPDEISLPAAQSRCEQEINVKEYYADLRSAGLEYGLCFQGITRLWQNNGEALGFMRLSDAEPIDDNYQIHPALFDACLQISIAALPELKKNKSRQGVYLPVGMKKVRMHRRFPDQVWANAVVQTNDVGDGKDFAIDLYMFDETGQIVAEIDSLYLKRVSRDALQRAIQSDLNDWLYEVIWERKALDTEAGAGISKQEPGDWLIFADQGGVGTGLARRIEEQGGNCVRVVSRNEHTAANDSTWRINPTKPGDFQHLFDDVVKAGRQLHGVAYMWGLDSKAGQETDQEQICGGLLHLVQAMVGVGGEEPPRLLLVTRGVQPAGQAPEQLAVAQAPLWGLGSTITTEHPELNCERLDLDPWPETDEGELLFQEICSNNGEAQVALRQSNRYVARLVRSRFTDEGADSRLALPDDQPYRLGLTSRGTLENIELQPMTRRQPGPGEVEIGIQVTGLNFKDVLKSLGRYSGPDELLGDECAGTITDVGEGVKGLRVGDEVVAVAPGSFSSYVITRSDLVAPKPDNLSFVEAVTVPITFLTAYFALHHLAKLSAGKRVLIHAAAGGVGLAAVQFAQQAGAEIFATAGSPRKRAYLRSLGIPHVMNSRTLEFAEEVMDLTNGHGVDMVLNSLAGDYIPKSLSLLAPEGCFLEIGRTDIWEADQAAQLKPDISYFPIFLVDVVKEQPALIQKMLLDLMENIKNGGIEALPHRVFPINEAVDAFRYMAQAKHIGKIVLSHEAQMLRPAAANVRPDATYLVTGGLGGLGLKVAEWLVTSGARHLVLVGRGAASEAAAEVIGGFEKNGARVVVARADVSRKEQLSNVLSEVTENMPPLRGIIHAAGVLDDGMLAQQTYDRFAKVYAPKIEGAWNLHTLLLDTPLDFFVLFSSTAPLLGALGQGNYAAANAFLDALAHHRRAKGLPALSINWGPWEGVGMVAVADKRIQGRLLDQGLGFIPPDKGVQVLELLLRQNQIQAAVLPVDWAKFSRSYPNGTSRSFLSHLFQKAENLADREPAQPLPGQASLTSVPPNGQAQIENSLRDQAAGVLKLPVNSIDMQKPLIDFGLDSLMAVEFFNRIEKIFGKKLPLATLIEAPTIEQLANILQQNKPALTWSPLVQIQPGGSKPPFFCIHAHGGNVLSYYDLARYLGDDRPFYGIQALGLDGKPVGDQRIEDMAARYIDEIKTIQPKGPYYLGGWCMGGNIAFEMAQQLHGQGQDIALLALIQAGPFKNYPKYLPKTTSFHRLIYLILERIDFETSNLRALQFTDKGAYIWKKIKRLLSILEVEGERIFLPLLAKFQLNFSYSLAAKLKALEKIYDEANKSYIPRPFRGRTILFRSSKQPFGIYKDPNLGWGDLIKGELEIQEIPGHHLSILVEPSVRILAQHLMDSLNNAQKGSYQGIDNSVDSETGQR